MAQAAGIVPPGRRARGGRNAGSNDTARSVRASSNVQRSANRSAGVGATSGGRKAFLNRLRSNIESRLPPIKRTRKARTS